MGASSCRPRWQLKQKLAGMARSYIECAHVPFMESP